jgi:hypothetical protein
MRAFALLFAAGRAVFGLVLMLRPGTISRTWIGEDAEKPGPEMLVRTIGARDFILGLGGVLAIANGGRARGWLEAGVMADVADTVITIAYFGKTPKNGSLTTLALTLTAGLAGYRLATRVDRGLDHGGDAAEAA